MLTEAIFFGHLSDSGRVVFSCFASWTSHTVVFQYVSAPLVHKYGHAYISLYVPGPLDIDIRKHDSTNSINAEWQHFCAIQTNRECYQFEM